ncbi:mannose-1-phosphate guanylyltransferase [Erythrobacter rubeus]|uniref:Mannose-1-phosphate guanylyltransferase n=1 Tax=Erythrobacter rubeus TaxID=2760803 RepID=A0ABR8KTT3_9SPHN|nr:sugar phosphate nucleotidyltransferase [Erythrobacter rubeus]MBD2842842.1 mannose-1-phosphate guanylyltransferase [Erythrobacter rubeus]
MPNPIHPVILCGGSGTRLWPVSRKDRPKPFLPLIGERTLFEEAVGRVASDDRFAAPIVVAGERHIDLIEAQIGSASKHRLIVEPCARNTAPAIALAAAMLPADDIMLVCPSDHHIADEAAFRASALAAAILAADDWLVSFGIAATHPETGYGYLQRGEPLPGGYRIAQFVEKPDIESARSYLASGDYGWNGGIFAFRAGFLLDELRAHRPQMADLVERAAAEGAERGKRFYPAQQPFAAINGESIDYAVMENTARAAMVPADMGWSDIGNWAALHDALKDGREDGNVTRGTVDLDGCGGVLALSDGPRISAIGLEDVCIVVSGDEVLVTTREGAQSVGKLPGATEQ